MRAANPANVAGDDAEGNLIPQSGALEFKRVEPPAFIRDTEVGSINAQQTIIESVTAETIVKQNLQK